MKLDRTRQAVGEVDRSGDRPPETHALTDLAGRVWDALAPALGEALTDIRKKAVEEPWFGREVTDRELDITRHGTPEVSQARPLTFADLIRAQTAMLPHPDQDSPHPSHGGPER